MAAVALIGVLRVAFEAVGSDTASSETSRGLDLLARGLDHYAPAQAQHHPGSTTTSASTS